MEGQTTRNIKTTSQLAVKVCPRMCFFFVLFFISVHNPHTADWAVSSHVCARLTNVTENLAERDRAEKAQAQVERGWRRRHGAKLQR